MDKNLIEPLARELEAMCCRMGKNSRSKDPPAPDRDACRRFAAKTDRIVHRLMAAPYTPARTLAREMKMDREEIKLSYKLIQSSPEAATLFMNSPNGDYLNIVKHYFNCRMYVVVFFVGLSCPGRCVFCPNVTVDEDGTRTLSIYRGGRDAILGADAIDEVFEDISKMNREGIPILVKISGGLEPMTDPDTMRLILDNAKSRGVWVKLFTNGLLLDTPERRSLALNAKDIRISLSVLSEEGFGRLMFGAKKTANRFGLSTLLENVRELVRERERIGSSARIGINTVVLEENHGQMDGFVALAEDLGVDYIDFKPNYFTPYRPRTQDTVAQTVGRYKRERSSSKHPQIFLAGSLLKENVFWTHRSGMCPPHKQAKFKVFITPFGHCSPVHHGAFPSSDGDLDSRFTAGRIRRGHSLSAILDKMPELPALEYDKLNPFEHMLALEIEREEADAAWGISGEYNPYCFSTAPSLPRDMERNPVLKRMVG